MAVIIGDVHGRLGEYLKICKECKSSVQVGDLSNSFKHIKKMLPPSGHRFIRGNHDPRGEIAGLSQWIPDGTVEDGVFYIGSADHVVNTGEPDRTLSHDEWVDVEVAYRSSLPSVVISHDCPITAGAIMDRWGYMPSYTSSWLQSLFRYHVPDLWVFGHWHQSRRFTAEGCKFVCLDMLECYNLGE